LFRFPIPSFLVSGTTPGFHFVTKMIRSLIGCIILVLLLSFIRRTSSQLCGGGESNICRGPDSTAMGESAIASGAASTAMGGDTAAGGDYSTAMGLGTTASGAASTAMGLGTTASGDGSTATGAGTTASEYCSTAMGQHTTASGRASTVMGYNTTASAYASTAMGLDTTASGYASTAMGQGTTAAGDFSLVIGTYNSVPSNPSNFSFIIGNGASSSSSNAMTVDTGGNVWISGKLTQASDRRLKENIELFKLKHQDVTSKLNQIEPVYYEWKDKKTHGEGVHLGVIAQDVQEEFPELIMTDSEGYLSVDYSRLSVILLQAVKNQQSQIQQQQFQHEELVKELKQMKQFLKEKEEKR